MTQDIRVEWYWDGKLKVFQLPDGSVLRQKTGSGDQPFEFVKRFLREEKGLGDVRLSFHEIAAPNRPRRG